VPLTAGNNMKKIIKKRRHLKHSFTDDG